MSCGGSMGKKKMAKGGSTKKLVKAQNGLFKKKTWTNTVSPDEETVLSTRPGMRGSTVNVITDAKTGKKIDRYRTPGLTRKQEKANEVYAKNPAAAKEDDFVPFTTKKKGGAMKSYKTGGSTGIVGMPKYGDNPRVQPFKKGGAKKSFPDLTGDGKLTKADILKGRGVIKKTSGVAKMQYGGSKPPVVEPAPMPKMTKKELRKVRKQVRKKS